ncbi:MAG: erythromycin esterase family protein [Candidatus Eremiobacteraeota bacterium]|nr:erythromycin esterase family protein [Candidatus Eremiobacteraeota bacterium]
MSEALHPVRALLPLSLVVALISAAVGDSRVDYLRLHAVRIRSIAPDDRDFSDLEPLRAAIGSRRIVMLGEESHGDGATFLAKTRLIEFLHERMGFNVLAFESGFYDVHRAWQDVAAGADPMQAIRSSIFSLWTNVRQTQALWQYVALQSRAQHPLVLAGIDSQFTGTASKQHFVSDLTRVLGELPQDVQTRESRVRVLGILNAYFAKRPGIAGLETAQRATTITEQARFYIAIEKLRDALGNQQYSDPSKAAVRDYWVQVLASTSLQFQHFWHEDFKHLGDNPGPTFDWATFNLRDEAMGENVVWLARHEFAGEKIVIWAATSHEMRHRQFFTNEYTGYVPMGDWIDRAMRAEVYTIGFTSFQGKAGIGEPRDIGVSAAGSIESLIHATGEEYALLDFRHLGAAGSWLTESLSCRALGYAAYTTDWPATIDGLFYIREMTPSTLM